MQRTGYDFYGTGELSDANACHQEGSPFYKRIFHRGGFSPFLFSAAQNLLDLNHWWDFCILQGKQKQKLLTPRCHSLVLVGFGLSIGHLLGPQSFQVTYHPLLLVSLAFPGLEEESVSSSSCSVKRVKLFVRAAYLPDPFSSSQMCLSLKPGGLKYCLPFLSFSWSETSCLSALESWEPPCVLDSWREGKVLGDPDCSSYYTICFTIWRELLFPSKWKWASLRSSREA